MSCIFSIIKTSIIFGTGVYTGIYVTQNYKVKKVNNPATVLSKIKSCIMKVLSKSSNKAGESDKDKNVDKDKTHPLGDADTPNKKPVNTYAVTAVSKFGSKVTSVAHCDKMMAESKLNGDKKGCIVKQIKSVKNNMFN